MRAEAKKKSGRWGVAAVVGGAAVTLAGCGIGAQANPQPLDAKAVPYGLLSPAPHPTSSVPGLLSSTVTIYLEGPNQHLVAVRRRVAWPATVASVLAQLSVGPTSPESSRGLVSPASAVGPLAAGAVRNGVLSVELPASFESLDGNDQTVAAAQIVFSATTFSAVRGVLFFIGGQPAHVPNGNGSLTPGPSTRRDYLGLAG